MVVIRSDPRRIREHFVGHPRLTGVLEPGPEDTGKKTGAGKRREETPPRLEVHHAYLLAGQVYTSVIQIIFSFSSLDLQSTLASSTTESYSSRAPWRYPRATSPNIAASADRVLIGHLLRRIGFGPTPEEVARVARMGVTRSFSTLGFV